MTKVWPGTGTFLLLDDDLDRRAHDTLEDLLSTWLTERRQAASAHERADDRAESDCSSRVEHGALLAQSLLHYAVPHAPRARVCSARPCE